MKTWLDLEAEAPDGWFSQYDIAVLYPVVEQIPSGGTYLEVGTYHGRSLWIARQAALPSVDVWGIDKLPDPQIPGTHFLRRSSRTAPWDRPLDVLFIDGDHSYAGCKNDWKRFSPFVKPGGIVLFHDCDETSPGVVRVFEEIGDGWTDKTVYKRPGLNTSICSVRRAA